MPPKGSKTPTSPSPPGVGPWVLLTIEVDNGSLIWDGGAISSIAGQPNTCIRFSLSGAGDEAQPIVSNAVSAHAPGSYSYALSTTVAYRLGPDVTDKVLNTIATAWIVRADTKQVIGKVRIDPIALLCGKTEIYLDQIRVDPVSQDGSALQLLPGSSLTAKMRLQEIDWLRPSTAASASPPPSAGATRSPAAPAAPPMVQVITPVAADDPDARPRALIPEDQAAGCNVLELQEPQLAGVPASYKAAAAAAQGRLSVTAGLVIPATSSQASPAVLPFPGGVLDAAAGDVITWPGSSRRAYISPQVVMQMRAALQEKRPLQLEVARYLAPGEPQPFSDPAFEAYRGMAVAQGYQALAQPGEVVASISSAPLGSCSAAGSAPLLPSPTPPSGKAKSIEEAPSAAAAAAAAGEVPCAWLPSSTRLTCTAKVLYPITPPWESPPRPSKTLAELVPRATPPPRPRESAAQTFQKAVQQAATHLAQLLQRAAGSVEAACKLSRQDMSALLNQSGTYLQLREQLKAAVMALARERYGGRQELTAEQLKANYGELYTHLLEQMQAVLKAAAAGTGTAAAAAPSAALLTADSSPAQVAARQDALLALAQEVEVAGDAARCESLLLEAVALAPSPSCWHSYAMSCARAGRLARCQEALQEAVALDQGHLPSLMASTVLHLHRALVDPEVHALEQALVTADAAKEAHQRSAAAWSMLAAVYQAHGAQHHKEAASCRYRAEELATAAAGEAASEQQGSSNSSQQQPTRWWQCSGPLEAAKLAVDMHLPAAAAALLQEATEEEAAQRPGTSQVLQVLQAQLLLLQGDAAAAVQALEQVTSLAAAGSLEPSMALDVLAVTGDCHLAAGSVAQARQCFCKTFKAAQTGHAEGRLRLLGSPAAASNVHSPHWPGLHDPHGQQASSVPTTPAPALVWEGSELLRVALALGHIYADSGDHSSELATFVAAAEIAPCATSWLGAGTACLAVGDLGGADLALVAANSCDSAQPGVWGQLALLAARSGRTQEAKQALLHACQAGLSDDRLAVQVAESTLRAGQPRLATAVVAEHVRDASGVQVQLLLAEVCLALEQQHEAHQHVQAAEQLMAGLAQPPAGSRAAAQLKCDQELAAQLNRKLNVDL